MDTTAFTNRVSVPGRITVERRPQKPSIAVDNTMRLGTVLALALVSGCAQARAELDVTLTPPVASRFVVHGNCFVGWFLGVDLLVRETRGVEVAVESVSFRVEDAAGRLLGERVVESAELAALYGESAVRIPAHGEIRIPMGIGPLVGPVEAPAIDGPVVASGTVLAADEQGGVRRAYRMPSAVTVAADPLPTAGACGAPPGG